jgi:DNA polymerase-3 subunit delta
VPPLSLSALRNQLGSGTTGPLYALLGADEVEKSAVAAEFVEMVDEGLRAFNVDRMYGGESKVNDLVDAARTLPMMVPRRVVMVLEAEKLLAPKRDSKAAEEELERLEAFLADPPDGTTVVFVCGALDMRRRVVKQLLSRAHVVDSGSIASEADAERWVAARAARDGVALDPGAARALAARSGLDLTRLRRGLERLGLYALDRTATAEDVRQVVTAAPESQVDFGIAKAIWRNDAREALKELDLVLEGGGVPVMILGQLRTAAEKLPGPRVRAAIEAVFRTDLALKSSGGEPRILLERLVVELCAGGTSRAGGAGRAGRAGWRR